MRCWCAPVLAGALSVAQAGAVQKVAPDVYFHEGDHGRGYCNNTWIVLDDYVVVIDANFPAGAEIVVPLIHTSTRAPVRFVVDTHFHPDHSFGNQVWADQGASIVASNGTLDELQRFGAEAWKSTTRERPDVASSRLKLPNVVYTDFMAFDDGRHRVELRWPGVAHTHGDTLVWLPHERILITGDLTVNGSYNYVHDSDIRGWIKVLEAAKEFGARTVLPGHGPMGGPEIVIDQQAYFLELERGVKALVDQKKTLEQVKAATPVLAAALRKIPNIARYVPADVWFIAHVEKMYEELTSTAR